jgi:hypothetical protein
VKERVCLFCNGIYSVETVKTEVKNAAKKNNKKKQQFSKAATKTLKVIPPSQLDMNIFPKGSHQRVSKC